MRAHKFLYSWPVAEHLLSIVFESADGHFHLTIDGLPFSYFTQRNRLLRNPHLARQEQRGTPALGRKNTRAAPSASLSLLSLPAVEPSCPRSLVRSLLLTSFLPLYPAPTYLARPICLSVLNLFIHLYISLALFIYLSIYPSRPIYVSRSIDRSVYLFGFFWLPSLNDVRSGGV